MTSEDSMPIPDQKKLLQLMEETHTKMESVLPQVDSNKEIYPGWTIREVLAHVTGWDEATIEALHAHIEGRPLSIQNIPDIDEYNEMSVFSRAELDNEQVLKEWRSNRQVLRTIIEEKTVDKFSLPVNVPWGGNSTIMTMMEMFCEHEAKHTRDVQKWLQHPDTPLMEEGE
jgi:Mycothiol maleylpyruvate isomerase N-terminal domain.